MKRRTACAIIFGVPALLLTGGAIGYFLRYLPYEKKGENMKAETSATAQSQPQPQFVGESYLETQNFALDVNGKKEGVSYSTLMDHLKQWGEGAITVYGRQKKPAILDLMNDSVDFGSDNWEEAYKSVAKLSNPSAIQTHHQTEMEGHEEGLFVYDMNNAIKPLFASELKINN